MFLTHKGIWYQFHQPWLVISTFHRQGRCSRGGHLCNEHSEEKYSCYAVINKIRPLIFSYVFVSINYMNASWYWWDWGAFMTSLRQLKRFEARISLFKSLDCPLSLAAAGRNQRFTRYPPVINHNLGWCYCGPVTLYNTVDLGQHWFR